MAWGGDRFDGSKGIPSFIICKPTVSLKFVGAVEFGQDYIRMNTKT